MALTSAFVVYVEKSPYGSFGDTMNDIRAWLDHHKMQPASFKAANGRYEIAFNSEVEARHFEREFGDLIRPTGLSA